MRWIIGLLWILLGVFYYFAQQNCCTDVITKSSEQLVPISQKMPIKKLSPISFNCQSDTPNTDNTWDSYRDSLVNSIGDDRILEIKTYEFKDERGDQVGDLAVARGTNVRKLFSELPENKIRFESDIFEDDCIKKRMYELVELRALRNSTKVKETANGSTIYFPSNSTEKVDDPDIEAYLDDVAKRVIQSNERVRLTGHTDATGDPAKNMQLGLERANSIKSYLMNKGVSERQILASSKGQADPIASNNTKEGRDKNRRTELEIIK